ncbi:MAG: hypothetical protein FWG03_10655 [Clostridiales bacterium]|nr:hypothetical protein [Clostridiales bacterium]
MMDPHVPKTIWMMPLSFWNEEQMLRTILHEKAHLKQVLKDGAEAVAKAPRYYDVRAYRVENIWYTGLARRIKGA